MHVHGLIVVLVLLLSLLVKVDIYLIIWGECHIYPLDYDLSILKCNDLVHLSLLQGLSKVIPRIVLLKANVLRTEVVWNDKAGSGRLVTSTPARKFLLLDVILR